MALGFQTLKKGFTALFNSTGLESAERARHDVRAFFVCFIIGNTLWLMLASLSVLNMGRIEVHQDTAIFRSIIDGVAAWLLILGVYGVISGAAMIVGCFFGFLFGIPRALVYNTDGSGHQTTTDLVLPNTNLEQVSDWLTKILIGVGLAQFHTVIDLTGKLFDKLEYASTHQLFGLSAVAATFSFGMGGFLWSYFESRTSLLAIFNESFDKKVKMTHNTKNLSNELGA